MPKLLEDLYAVPDGEIYPKWFRAGEDVTGDVAKAARSRGILEWEKPARKTQTKRKAMSPPENKGA